MWARCPREDVPRRAFTPEPPGSGHEREHERAAASVHPEGLTRASAHMAIFNWIKPGTTSAVGLHIGLPWPGRLRGQAQPATKAAPGSLTPHRHWSVSGPIPAAAKSFCTCGAPQIQPSSFGPRDGDRDAHAGRRLAMRRPPLTRCARASGANESAVSVRRTRLRSGSGHDACIGWP